MSGRTFGTASMGRHMPHLGQSGCLYNPAQMERVLRREIARSDRGGRGFALVLFRVGTDDDATRYLADTLERRVRLTDEVGWFSREYLAAVLTGTQAVGARTFADGVSDAVSQRFRRPAASIYTYQSAPKEPAYEEAAVPSRSRANGRGRERIHVLRHADGPDSVQFSSAVALMDPPEEPEEREPEDAPPPVEMEPADLAGFVQDGFSDELEQTRTSSLFQEFLTSPTPRWKRVIDVIGALIGLVLFSPLMLLAAIGVYFSSPGPILFRQKRSGLGGRPFHIYKFRTMVDGAEARRKDLERLNEQDGPAFKLQNDPRVTRFGRLLRKTSIDELPQLYNVLRGDMSLVGPRPLPCGEAEACLPWQRHRHNIAPGLTCIWQVKGRSRVAFDDWVRMDMAYMRRRSFWKDVQILFATIPAVLLRKGAK